MALGKRREARSLSQGVSLVLVVCVSPGCGALRPGDLDGCLFTLAGLQVESCLLLTLGMAGGGQAVTVQGNLAGLGWWEAIAVGEGIGGKVLARGD